MFWHQSEVIKPSAFQAFRSEIFNFFLLSALVTWTTTWSHARTTVTLLQPHQLLNPEGPCALPAQPALATLTCSFPSPYSLRLPLWPLTSLSTYFMFPTYAFYFVSITNFLMLHQFRNVSTMSPVIAVLQQGTEVEAITATEEGRAKGQGESSVRKGACCQP